MRRRNNPFLAGLRAGLAAWGGAVPAGLLLLAAGAAVLRPDHARLLDGAVVLLALFILVWLLWVVRPYVAAARRRDLLHGGVGTPPEYAFVIDSAGRLLIANDGAHAFLGGSRQPFNRLVAAIPPDDAAARDEIARLMAAARAGQAGLTEIRLRLDADGAAVPVVLRASRIPEPAGAIVVAFAPVTAAQEAGRAEAARRDVMLTVIDTIPIGLYALDATGRFLWANRRLADWLGTTLDSLNGGGATLADFLPDEVPSGAYMDTTEGTELALITRQGTPLRLVLRQTVHRGDTGIHTCSVVRNLAPDSMRDGGAGLARQRFQRFFEFAPVGIAFADIEARFKETNHALDVFLDAAPADLQTRSLYDFVPQEDHAAIAARLNAAGSADAAPDPIVKPLEIRLKAPRDRIVALFVSRLEAPGGAVGGFILYFMDLTEQKNLELQFAQSQKMQAVGQLAGGVAHDFNNLLTAMNGFCDLLLLRFRPGDQSFGDLMQIKQNANRAASLVRQLLAFSRQQTLQPRVIDVSEVLGELSHLLHRLLGETVELKLFHGRGLGRVKVDPGQLEQVIINLAVNARDAMSRNGTLTIRTENVDLAEPIQREAQRVPAGAYVLIEVSDDGTGIPPEIMGRIFEPFFSTKDVGSGTGLGLSMVYGIVTQTGGFILVDSTLGAGTRFSIYLPRWQEKDEDMPTRPAATEAPVPRDLTGSGTILLVEDEAPVRMFTVRALQNKGYTVLEAKSGEAALDILAQETTPPIDLVITDVMMPRMDGPTLIEHIRAQMPMVKVIFISGYAEETFTKRLTPGSDVYFLPKPFSLKELAARVKEIMTTGA